MNRSFYKILCFLCVVISISGCNKDELDALYGKPANLAAPILEQLEARGRFNSMLIAIEKAGYKDILKGAGYWTLLAPNDDAFAKYLQSRGLSSVNDLDKETAAQIVRYSLIYNTYLRKDISTYESPERILIPGAAFRRKTAYYEFVYDDHGRKVISSNDFEDYLLSDNNNKYVPVFTSEFRAISGVTETDYKTFYPQAELTAFNVADAKALETDIVAENGIIHEIDKVVLPELSFDRYLESKPEYSEFKSLLDKYATYTYNYTLTNRYKALTGKTDSVFVKEYSAGMFPFPLGSESYIGLGGTQGQAGSYSLLVPTNDQLRAYKAQLLQRWGSNELSIEMARYLINAHIYNEPLWPSKMALTKNALSELGTIGAANVVEYKMLSSGPFYGINAVQPANAFRTVYSKPFLDKDYLLQTRGLNGVLRPELIDPDRKSGLIMLSDAQFKNAGYSWDDLNAQYRYAPPVGDPMINATARDRFMRIVYMTAFDNSFLNLTNLSGEGVLKGSKGEGEESEYIYYKNNIIKGSGNFENNNEVTVDRIEMTANGPVFYTSGILLFAEKPIGSVIRKLATDKPDVYGTFFKYLSDLQLIDDADNIVGITTGVNYTVFIPTNAAFLASNLPKNANGTMNTNPADLNDRDKAVATIMYHFIEKRTFAPDGDPDKKGLAITSYKDIDKVDPNTSVTIAKNTLGAMEIRGAKNTTNATLLLPNSNVLANKALIHSIDQVLLIK